MRNLFALLRKHYFFFMFIILEVLSFSLIINHNNYPNTVFFNSTNQITGSTYRLFSNISEYLSLRKANLELAEENAILRNQIKYAFVVTDTNSFLYKDTLFRFISAMVVNNSIHKRNNYFMLNKGKKHGVKPEMGVISPRGTAGIIISVSKNYSTAMSLLHNKVQVSAKIKKNNQSAIVIWNGRNYREGILEDIPTHINLYQGDSIITSGNSFFFPEGILIGIVKKHERQFEENLNKATITFATDFNSIKHVYIAKNLMVGQQREQINSLQND